MWIVVPVVGCFVSVVILVISALMNIRFGLSLSDDVLTQWICATISGCADAAKAIAPFAIKWAWRDWSVVGVVAWCIVLVVCLVFSVTSSIGFVSSTRAAASNDKQLLFVAVESAEAEVARITEEYEALAHVRSASEIGVNGAHKSRRLGAHITCSYPAFRALL